MRRRRRASARPTAAATSPGSPRCSSPRYVFAVRGHHRPADHRGARRDGAGPPRAHQPRKPTQRELSRARVPRGPATAAARPGRLRPAQRGRHPGAAARRHARPSCRSALPARRSSTTARELSRPDAGGPSSKPAGRLSRRRASRRRIEQGGRRVNPANYLLPVRDPVHHRRGRRAGAAQRDRRVHVRRADAQRVPTWRSSRSPGCTATSTARSSRSSSWWWPQPRSWSAWRSS